LVDLASMRDAVCRLGHDPDVVNFSCLVNLIVDHSLCVDFSQRYVEKHCVGLHFDKICSLVTKLSRVQYCRGM